MNYSYRTNIKDNDAWRRSFNELTQQTFCFDFEDWYAAGHWGEMYIPHVLCDGDKVITNVSVNLMQFDVQGVKKNYIQIGTVMTDEAYRGQGLNREIMERILEEYVGKADGIYLFANDSVVNYYPKFGFKPAKEYEYYMTCEKKAEAYTLKKVDAEDQEQCEELYELIRKDAGASDKRNENDGMYMSENLGLYQFWIAAGFGEDLFYIPETGNYAAAKVDGAVLRIHQIFGKQQVDIARLAASFGEAVKEVVLEYTPAHKEAFLVREHKEEDCTLFILGEDLERVEGEKMMFPVMSHA